MFRVAVCDDEEFICARLESIILSYKHEIKEQLEVEAFYSGEDLYKSLKNNIYFDIIFLDIELKGLNGIELGRIIREDLKDEITQIVYISSKQEYAMELFENRPLNFIIKGTDISEIIRVLKKGISLIKKQNNSLEFIYHRNSCKVPYKDIIYLESNDKKIILFTNTTTYEFYGKLSEIAKQLETTNFIQIHKSYIINYLYMAEAQKTSVIMSNGEKLPISQTYKKDFRSKLLNIRRERQQ